MRHPLSQDCPQFSSVQYTQVVTNMAESSGVYTLSLARSNSGSDQTEPAIRLTAAERVALAQDLLRGTEFFVTDVT